MIRVLDDDYLVRQNTFYTNVISGLSFSPIVVNVSAAQYKDLMYFLKIKIDH